MYVAVLMVSAVVDGITPDRTERVLRVVRDHARDAPVTALICKEAKQALPALRPFLPPTYAPRKTRGSARQPAPVFVGRLMATM
jgi:hypothetical protein